MLSAVRVSASAIYENLPHKLFENASISILNVMKINPEYSYFVCISEKQVAKAERRIYYAAACVAYKDNSECSSIGAACRAAAAYQPL